MSRLARNPYYRQYSPFFMGGIFVILIYLGLAILFYQVSPPSGWSWFVPLLLLALAIALQLTTKRVVYIRLFQSMLMVIVSLIYGISFLVLIANHQSYNFKWLTASLMTIMIILIYYASYRANAGRKYLHDLPHGPVGTLDHRTGFIDPYKSPPLIQKHQDELQSKRHVVWRLAPLTAGLAMVLVRGLPSSGLNLLLIFLSLVVATGSSGGAGGALYYAIASRRWEVQNGKLMLVRK